MLAHPADINTTEINIISSVPTLGHINTYHTTHDGGSNGTDDTFAILISTQV